MKHLLWTLVTLFVTVAWLFFSYAPSWLSPLPQVTIQGSWSGVMQGLAVLCFILLVILQLQLVWSTKRILQRQNALPTHETTDKFRLNPLLELIWTAVPLLLVVGLAFASYHAWLNLSSP